MQTQTNTVTDAHATHWLVRAIRETDLKSLGLTWKRCADQPGYYELNGCSQRGITTVWKSYTQWGGRSGRMRDTLRDMKLAEEFELREKLAAEAVLLIDTSRAPGEGDDRVTLSWLALRIFTELLKTKVSTVSREAFIRRGVIGFVGKDSRLGNAYRAVEMTGTDGRTRSLNMLEAAMSYRCGDGVAHCKLDSLALVSSMLVEVEGRPHVWETDLSFGDNGRIKVPVSSWDEDALDAAIEHSVESGLAYMGAGPAM